MCFWLQNCEKQHWGLKTKCSTTNCGLGYPSENSVNPNERMWMWSSWRWVVSNCNYLKKVEDTNKKTQRKVTNPI
jgi:hypothetical protein